MASLTIKGIPEDLLENLRARAQAHRRSLNSELLFLLERSLEPHIVEPGAFLNRIEALNQRAAPPPLTEALLDQAINEGRP